MSNSLDNKPVKFSTLFPELTDGQRRMLVRVLEERVVGENSKEWGPVALITKDGHVKTTTDTTLLEEEK